MMGINISSRELLSNSSNEERLENVFKFIYTSLSEECKSAIQISESRRTKELLWELSTASTKNALPLTMREQCIVKSKWDSSLFTLHDFCIGSFWKLRILNRFLIDIFADDNIECNSSGYKERKLWAFGEFLLWSDSWLTVVFNSIGNSTNDGRRLVALNIKSTTLSAIINLNTNCALKNCPNLDRPSGRNTIATSQAMCWEPIAVHHHHDLKLSLH